jgi:hypothetical protein
MKMSEDQLENWLYLLLAHGEEAVEVEDNDGNPSIMSVLPYQEAGMMTYNKGLVITTSEGDEFQLTIIKSR